MHTGRDTRRRMILLGPVLILLALMIGRLLRGQHSSQNWFNGAVTLALVAVVAGGLLLYFASGRRR